ncbi:DUF6350 family protein [Cellulomonas sp. URHD0024]|uniref:cell division protein PerM n=1 Tax=Cellulomonas sp. URHD0024 TaxID=1302620 RepID=UPI0004269C2B|nr:DUF6350 family protein [Cellulomonas sp. URHD0024]
MTVTRSVLDRTRPRSSRTRGRRRPDGTEQFFTSALDGAPRWVAGVLAALQAALLSFLVLVLPAVAAYVATSADPSNDGVGWYRSVGVGTSIWLLGHGVPVVVGSVSITIVPLGVTLLALFTCYASARRSGLATWPGFGAGVAAYVLVAVGAALLVHVHGLGLVRAVVGGVVVSGLGLGSGLLARPEAPAWRELTRPLWTRVPHPVRTGSTGGLFALALLVVVAAAVATLWVVAGRATISDVVRGLGIDGIGGIVLAFAELAFVPNLVVWATAWLTGDGFSVGSGTLFAPDAVVGGPLPAVPLLGALPTPDVAGPATSIVPIVLVGIGALTGLYVHNRLRATRWWHVLAASGTAALVLGALLSILVALASGSVGPGRLEHVGANALLVGLLGSAMVLLGAVVVAVPGDPLVRHQVRRLVARASRSGTHDAQEHAREHEDEHALD